MSNVTIMPRKPTTHAGFWRRHPIAAWTPLGVASRLAWLAALASLASRESYVASASSSLPLAAGPNPAASAPARLRPPVVGDPAYVRTMLRRRGSKKATLVPPPEPLKDVEVSRGSTVDLTCAVATDNRNAVIVWLLGDDHQVLFYGSNRVTDDRRFTLRILVEEGTTRSTLRIASVRVSDRANYTCRVPLKERIYTHVIRLTVRGEPSSLLANLSTATSPTPSVQLTQASTAPAAEASSEVTPSALADLPTSAPFVPATDDSDVTFIKTPASAGGSLSVDSTRLEGKSHDRAAFSYAPPDGVVTASKRLDGLGASQSQRDRSSAFDTSQSRAEELRSSPISSLQQQQQQQQQQKQPDAEAYQTPQSDGDATTLRRLSQLSSPASPRTLDAQPATPKPLRSVTQEVAARRRRSSSGRYPGGQSLRS